jgi:mannose-6-phosphate isomerase-like protein (cupin superfamily)
MSTLNDRIVRYGELRPCKTAFIDAHTPGSDQKENFTIIGGGVSESPDQHVHIRDTPGFNIGAAGQPPNCRNSLHSHTTAEVFFVLKGRWRFFWGRNGDAGEFIAEEGDIFNIPTGIFRGFENVGTDYGMIMAILGGDDAGGGVTWAPQVIEEARAHGLVLGNNGVLYDSKQGQELPHNVQPMPTLTEEQMKDFPETPVEAVVPRYVARYWDLMALSGKQPAKVIGTDALLKDKPGFEVDFLSRNSLDDSTITPDKHVVLMPMRGHWALRVGDFDTVLNPGDTCLLKPGESYSLAPSMTGEASLYRVTETDDPAGATWSGAA